MFRPLKSMKFGSSPCRPMHAIQATGGMPFGTDSDAGSGIGGQVPFEGG
jgi:hypothetical protein